MTEDGSMFVWDDDYDELVKSRDIRIFPGPGANAARRKPFPGVFRLTTLLCLPSAIVLLAAPLISAITIVRFAPGAHASARSVQIDAVAAMPADLLAYQAEQYHNFSASIARFRDHDLATYIRTTMAALGDGSGAMAPFYLDALLLSGEEARRRGLPRLPGLARADTLRDIALLTRPAPRAGD